MLSAIDYQNVTKQYGRILALDNFSLSIPQGSISFILGLNGAGKTTLLKSTLGHTPINSGEIKFGKTNPSISAVIETPTFYENLTAKALMTHMSILRRCKPEFSSTLLSYVGLSVEDKRPVRKYSLGMRQRLKLALALLVEPDIIILDEPLNGLDPDGINQMKNILIKINREKGTTIILSSHLIKETEGIATDYAIIHHGKLMSRFNKEDLDSKLNCLHISTDNYSTLLEGIGNVYDSRLRLFVKKSDNIIKCYAQDAKKVNLKILDRK